MDERKVILGFLLPPDKEPSAAVGPGMRTFDHPASRAFPFASRFLLFAAARGVEHVSAPSSEALDGLAVIALVQAEVLWTAKSAARAAERDSGESGLSEPLIVDVGTRDGNGQWYAPSIGENRSLDTELTAICRVFAGLFPPRAALSSSHHPYSASPTRCLSGDRTRVGTPSRDDETPRASSILESSDALCSPNQNWTATPSIGNQYATRKRFRRQPLADRRAADLPWDYDRTWAAAVRTAATISRGSEQTCHSSLSA